MSKKFNNHTELNNGFFLNGATPLDDRLVWTSMEDFYIDAADKESSKLYGVAYEGMQVSIVEDNAAPRLFILRDVYPYTPDNKEGEYAVNINEENFRSFWYEISAVELKSEDGTLTFEETETISGKSIDIKVNIDNDTLQNIDGVITGTKFKISRKSQANDNMLASYTLQHLLPGTTEFVDIPGSDDINVPKDYVVKEVHVCKATYDETTGKYTETIRQDQCTVEEWKAAPGEVYLHFIWETKDNEAGMTSESWLRVGDIIDVDLDSLEAAVAKLREDVDAIFDGEINFVHKTLETTASMLTDHGSLPKNTKVSDLEKMTISEILEKILFEIATPTRQNSSSVSASWGSVYGSTVNVGAELPAIENIKYTYTPETWKWVSKDGTVSDTQKLLGENGATYFFTTSNAANGGTDMSTADYTTHKTSNKVKEGTNGYFYMKLAQKVLRNATNSVGETISVPAATTISSNVLSFTGAWHLFSNANKEYTTAAAAWSARNTNPGAYTGATKQTETSGFGVSGAKIYLQWPQVAASETLYVYVPASRSIASVRGANPTISNTFDVVLSATQEGTVNITNVNGATGSFKKYKVVGSAGITTAEIKLS